MSVLTKLKSLFAVGPSKTDLEKRFHMLARVGQGSMSKLFRARDLMSGRTVALKILDKEKTARLMARDYGGAVRPSEGAVSVVLRHPNVVHTYEHGLSTKSEQFLVMEFIEGLGLNFLIETKSPQLKGKRIEYLVQAAEGLAYVHSQSFIHRDICPRNMMIAQAGSGQQQDNPFEERDATGDSAGSQSGVVKLIDCGLAVPNTPQFRRPGNRTGTAHYMAPELIRRDSTDERIDIFSFGVTAYECITGRLPWEASDSLEKLKLHINIPPNDPRKVMPEIDNELAELLLRAIAQNPKKRIGSMKELATALRGLKRQDY